MVKDGAIIAQFKVIVAVTWQAHSSVRKVNVGEYRVKIGELHRSKMWDLSRGGKSSKCEGKRNMSWHRKIEVRSEGECRHHGLFLAGFTAACCGCGVPHGNSGAWYMADSGKWMAEYCSETESQILGLQSNEDETHEEGQSGGTHCGGQRCPRCYLANEDPWTWVQEGDPKCTWCVGWCSTAGCSPWVFPRDMDGSGRGRWTEQNLPFYQEKVRIGMLLNPWRHHELLSWVDAPLPGWRWWELA